MQFYFNYTQPYIKMFMDSKMHFEYTKFNFSNS